MTSAACVARMPTRRPRSRRSPRRGARRAAGGLRRSAAPKSRRPCMIGVGTIDPRHVLAKSVSSPTSVPMSRSGIAGRPCRHGRSGVRHARECRDWAARATPNGRTARLPGVDFARPAGGRPDHRSGAGEARAPGEQAVGAASEGDGGVAGVLLGGCGDHLRTSPCVGVQAVRGLDRVQPVRRARRSAPHDRRVAAAVRHHLRCGPDRVARPAEATRLAPVAARRALGRLDDAAHPRDDRAAVRAHGDVHGADDAPGRNGGGRVEAGLAGTTDRRLDDLGAGRAAGPGGGDVSRRVGGEGGGCRRDGGRPTASGRRRTADRPGAPPPAPPGVLRRSRSTGPRGRRTRSSRSAGIPCPRARRRATGAPHVPPCGRSATSTCPRRTHAAAASPASSAASTASRAVSPTTLAVHARPRAWVATCRALSPLSIHPTKASPPASIATTGERPIRGLARPSRRGARQPRADRVTASIAVVALLQIRSRPRDDPGPVSVDRDGGVAGPDGRHAARLAPQRRGRGGGRHRERRDTHDEQAAQQARETVRAHGGPAPANGLSTVQPSWTRRLPSRCTFVLTWWPARSRSAALKIPR